MNIVLALHGQCRFFDKPHKWYKKNLFEANPDHNFYVVTQGWWDESTVGKAYNGAPWLDGGRAGYVVENTPQKIKDLYHPRESWFAKPPKIELSREYTRRNKSNPADLFSNWLSIENALEMACGDCDMVILSRYDLILKAPLILSDLPLDKFTHPDDVTPSETEPSRCNAEILISSSDNMCRFAHLFNMADRYYQDGVFMGGEEMFGHHINQIGWHNPINIPYAYVRGFGASSDANEMNYHELGDPS